MLDLLIEKLINIRYVDKWMIGTQEILIILFIVLILFGGKKLPELARAIGHSVKEFRKATKDVEDIGKEIKE